MMLQNINTTTKVLNQSKFELKKVSKTFFACEELVISFMTLSKLQEIWEINFYIHDSVLREKKRGFCWEIRNGEKESGLVSYGFLNLD